MVLLWNAFRKFRDIPIRIKLYVCIAFSLILPLIITMYYVNNQLASLNVIMAGETSLQILKQTNQNFKNLISSTNDLSLNLLAKDDVQKIASENFDEHLNYNKILLNISDWLDIFMGPKSFFDSICISRNNEIIFQKGTPVYVEEDNYLKEAVGKKGAGFWTDTYNLSSSPKTNKVISFYRAVNDLNMLEKNLAVERISVSEQTICNFFSEVNSYKNGSIFLVNSRGKVLSSPDKLMVGVDFSTKKYIVQALQEKEGFFFTEIGGQNNCVLFYTISEAGWHLIQTIPAKSLRPSNTTANTVLVIAIILCILFGVLFSFIQDNFFVKPLSRLLKEMDKLKNGNFNIVLNLEANDEIGKLNRGFTNMSLQLNERINDVYISKIKQREAELNALQTQINPHFLYNTLDSIHWLAVKNRDYDVSEQIEALSETFKHILSKGTDIVTIADELDLLENYIFIQKAKYRDRIKIVIDADPSLLSYKTPKLILQPLVENSILHGLEQKLEGGTVRVNIQLYCNCIRYIISDDGNGTDENKINELLASSEQSPNVFALKNIDERIKLKYGKEYGLSFYSNKGHGTRVEVLIPITE